MDLFEIIVKCRSTVNDSTTVQFLLIKQVQMILHIILFIWSNSTLIIILKYFCTQEITQNINDENFVHLLQGEHDGQLKMYRGPRGNLASGQVIYPVLEQVVVQKGSRN